MKGVKYLEVQKNLSVDPAHLRYHHDKLRCGQRRSSCRAR